MKTNIIGLKELRVHMNDYITQIENGRSFVVVRKSKPVFTISAPDDDEAGWRVLADFTKIHKDGVDGREILKRLRKMNHG